MPKQIIIAEQHRIAAVFSEDQIQELIVATGSHQVGDIYLGVVENVLPGIDAAFVNIGDSERNGFIHVSDLGPLRLRRSSGSITELLAPQQKVLVQIMKEPTGNKGPRLTGNISLPGRYLVLMPFGRGVNLSRRIRNEAERNRLRALAILVKPAGMGLLVRTEAEGMAEDAIIEDLEALQRQWENIQQEAVSTRPPNLLNRDDDFIQRVLRDVYSSDVNRIVVDSHTGVKRVKQHLMNWYGGKTPQGVLIDQHRDRIPVLEYFRVNAAIREALKPRVDLPSGGYIIIERTEALTVVDVNSGSFTRSATARETVLWTNCEAATEIARQLRLRNIAGVIIIDFIDMDARRDQLQVLEHFNKALRADKARPQIAQLSELGLVELTRKRQGQNIYELFGRPCTTCGGLGHLVHLPGEAERMTAEPAAESFRPAVVTESRAPQTREPWESSPTEEFDSSPAADLQELDLLNHPNYQERGRLDRRRRRSRGRVEPVSRSGEPVARSGEPVSRSSEPVSRNGEAAPRNGEATPRTIEPVSRNGASNGVFKAEPELEADAVEEETPIAPPTLVAKENRIEKQDKGRSAQRREKSVAEPPAMISVEMTPEEQSVYALMGISPLVLASTEVKDPKSTVVNITLPGETSRSDNGSTASLKIQPVTPVRTTPEVTRREQPAPVEAEPVQENGADREREAIATNSDSDTNSDAADSQEENGSAPRRRRRRSSASDNNGDS